MSSFIDYEAEDAALLAELKAKRKPFVKRYSLNPHQLKAFYGLPDITGDSKFFDVDVTEDDENEIQGRDSKRISGKSFNITKSMLEAFDETGITGKPGSSQRTESVAAGEVSLNYSTIESSQLHQTAKHVIQDMICQDVDPSQASEVSPSSFAATESQPQAVEEPNNSVNITPQEAEPSQAGEVSSSSFHITKSLLHAFDETAKPGSQRTSYQGTVLSQGSEASPSSFTITKSLIHAFDETVKTQKAISSQNCIPEEDEDAEDTTNSFTITKSAIHAFDETVKPQSQRTSIQSAGPSQASTASFSITKSVLQAFDETLKTQGPINSQEDAEDSTNSFSITKSVLRAFDETKNATQGPSQDSNHEQSRREHPNLISFGGHDSAVALLNETTKTLKEATQPTSDVNIVNETPENITHSTNRDVTMRTITPTPVKPPCQPIINQPAIEPLEDITKTFKSPQLPQALRTALILPRFMRATVSSTNHSVASPTNPAPSPCCERRKTMPPPKKYATPRKSIAVARRVVEQDSFHRVHLPKINFEQFEDIPKANPALRKVGAYKTPESGTKRAHPITPITPQVRPKPPRPSAIHLLKQYETPVAPRVPAKLSRPEVIPFSPICISSDENDDESGYVNDNDVLTIPKVNDNDAPTTPKRPPVVDIVRTPIDNDFANMSLCGDDENVENEPPNNLYDLDSSVYSVHTPGPIRRTSAMPTTIARIPLEFHDTFDDSDISILNNTAPAIMEDSTNGMIVKEDPVYLLAQPKLIQPEEDDFSGLRRSKRTRVRPLRNDLGEAPIYELDENGLSKLVGVTSVEIKDRRAQKYLTVDPIKMNERERERKKTAKKRREFAERMRNVSES